MKLKRTAKRLTEAKRSVDFMTLMKEAVRRAKRNDRLNERYGCSEDEEEVDTEAGLDELEGAEDELPADEDLDIDDADLDAVEDRPTVTITIPVDATIEEIQDAIDAASGEAEDAELDAAAEDAVDDIEAEAAADEEFGEDAAPTDDEDLPEEDEEAFAATFNEGPVRKQAQTTYNNDLTVKSNISATVGMGKPAVYSNGAATRTKAQTTYDNNLTIKSAIQPGVAWQR